MTVGCDLLERHIQTLVEDNTQWQKLIADDVLWELAYAPSIGHPAQLSGREEAVRHALWFVGAVKNFRFFELKVYALTDPERAVAEVKGEGVIKSTERMYRQDYVLFLRAAGGKIAFLREYFDPVRAARALDTRIAAFES
jgi:uncharacterized protein